MPLGAAECHCSLDRGYSNGSRLQAARDRLSLRLSNSDSIYSPGTQLLSFLIIDGHVKVQTERFTIYMMEP